MSSPAEQNLEAALKGRTDLNRYKDGHRDNRRLLFALQLYTGAKDIHVIAADALVDGFLDKSVDLLYVDRDNNVAYIAQGYEAVTKPTVDVSKVGSLHQAVSWALSPSGGTPPPQIRSAVEDLQGALTDGVINRVEIWYVHNRPEAPNVDEELKKVEATAGSLLASEWAHANDSGIAVTAHQVGLATLVRWYEGTQTPILVSDEYAVPCADFLTEACGNWQMAITMVSAQWLRDLAWAHEESLFSANIRSFMGSRTKINKEITRTVVEQGDKFAIFNNGVTAIVNGFERTSDGELRIRGISIVNGAQTVGAIGATRAKQLTVSPEARVVIRFIACPDLKTVRDVIRYTNRQNATQPADFRSNDSVQTRLVGEFQKLGIAEYDGARRGNIDEIVSANGNNILTAATVARVLAAFHGAPDLAHLEARLIWESDTSYTRYFSERTTAEHIVFCQGLYQALEARRVQLRNDPSDADDRKELLRFLNRRGASWLLIAAIGNSLGAILDRSINDAFRLRFGQPAVLGDAAAAWEDLVEKVAWYATSALEPVFAVRGGLKDEDHVRKALNEFREKVRSNSSGSHGIKHTCQAFAAQVTAD